MKRLFPLFFAIACLACCAVPSAYAEQRVYLLARVSIENTTWTEAVFLYDREVGDLSACEQDIARGQIGQWQYYGHFVRKRKGVATSVSYKCIATDLSISEWMSGNRYSYIYLIDRRRPDLKVLPHGNYADCLATLHRTQKEESGEFYCAKSNQVVGPAE